MVDLKAQTMEKTLWKCNIYVAFLHLSVAGYSFLITPHRSDAFFVNVQTFEWNTHRGARKRQRQGKLYLAGQKHISKGKSINKLVPNLDPLTSMRSTKQ